MKIYLAGALSLMSNDLFKRRIKILESYLTVKNKKILPQNISLFLDSGAFSAWSKGVEINIDEYILFIRKHTNHLDVYAVLDNINSPECTWENQEYMETAGLISMCLVLPAVLQPVSVWLKTQSLPVWPHRK